MCPLGISTQEVLPEICSDQQNAPQAWPGWVGQDVCLFSAGWHPQLRQGSCLRASLPGQQRALVPAEFVYGLALEHSSRIIYILGLRLITFLTGKNIKDLLILQYLIEQKSRSKCANSVWG